MKNQWTTANIPDLSGKTMIITEGDSSLGYETVKAFAMKGGKAVLACRNLAMGERIKSEITRLHEGANIEVMHLDLMDPGSIKAFGKAFNEQHERLDILMNLADIQIIPAGESAKHFGKQLRNDYAGHFLLTGLMLEKLASTPNARVVNLNIGEHKLKSKDIQRLMRKNGQPGSAKGRIGSFRWANQVFTYELQKYFDDRKVACTAVAAYPGPANRNLERGMRNHWSWRFFKPVYKLFTGPDSLESAMPGIRAALETKVKGGEYFGPGGFVEVNGYQSYNAVLQFVA